MLGVTLYVRLFRAYRKTNRHNRTSTLNETQAFLSHDSGVNWRRVGCPEREGEVARIGNKNRLSTCLAVWSVFAGKFEVLVGVSGSEGSREAL